MYGIDQHTKPCISSSQALVGSFQVPLEMADCKDADEWYVSSNLPMTRAVLFLHARDFF